MILDYSIINILEPIGCFKADSDWASRATVGLFGCFKRFDGREAIHLVLTGCVGTMLADNEKGRY